MCAHTNMPTHAASGALGIQAVRGARAWFPVGADPAATPCQVSCGPSSQPCLVNLPDLSLGSQPGWVLAIMCVSFQPPARAPFVRGRVWVWEPQGLLPLRTPTPAVSLRSLCRPTGGPAVSPVSAGGAVEPQAMLGWGTPGISLLSTKRAPLRGHQSLVRGRHPTCVLHHDWLCLAVSCVCLHVGGGGNDFPFSEVF